MHINGVIMIWINLEPKCIDLGKFIKIMDFAHVFSVLEIKP